jgi:hypothetical protein
MARDEVRAGHPERMELPVAGFGLTPIIPTRAASCVVDGVKD